MKKFLLILAAVSILTPFMVYADSYNGPFCYESKSETSTDNPDPSGIRGTCKVVQMKDVVNLDSAMQKDYFLGTHGAIFCGRGGCGDTMMYSESLTVNDSSTTEVSISENDYYGSGPTEFAVFDKSFFLPLLLNQFKQNNLNYSENDFPPIVINIYEPEEFNELQYGNTVQEDKMDTLQKDVQGEYSIDTFSYQEYGKYIWGPKADIVESQYADLNKNGEESADLTDKDLGISYEDAGHGGPIPTVSIISPLDSVTNYWIYSQINGKPTLSWQKTEYGMDDGTIKTILPTISNTTTTTVNKTASTTSSTSTAQNPVPAGKNIFQRIWDFVLSWFK
jgi:hypothetical protein